MNGQVPDAYYTLPIGKARICRAGEEATIVTYGAPVHWALELAEKEGYDLEIIDLRTLLPWDQETVFASVRKTGRVMVLHEDTLTGGIGAEIAAAIAEHCFQQLDAPVVRAGALDTPVPFSVPLEQHFWARSALKTN